MGNRICYILENVNNAPCCESWACEIGDMNWPNVGIYVSNVGGKSLPAKDRVDKHKSDHFGTYRSWQKIDTVHFF